MQQFPERRDTNHARHVSILDSFREGIAGEIGQVSNLRAAAERGQKSSRKFKRMVKRKHRQHSIFRGHIENGGKHRNHAR